MKQKSFNCITRAWLVALVLVAFSFAPQNAFAAESGGLDQAGLKQMLENLGYEPKTKKYDSGRQYYEIKKKGGTVTLTMDLYISNNDTMIWSFTSFWPLKEGQKFPNDVLLEAMTNNNKTVYVHFSFFKNKLTLSGSLANHNVRAVDLRKMLDEMLVVSDRTRHLWNPKYWNNKTAEKKPDATSAPVEKKDEKKAEKVEKK